jgi:steroid 5-alpha reductase family enzyme
MIWLIVAVAVFLSLAMMVAWQVQRVTGNAGWIDVVWSFATGAGGLVFALAPVGPGVMWRQWLVAVLVAIWSARLALHIAGRSRHIGDDPRYAFLRGEWGTAFNGRLFWFLQIQAFAAFVLAATVLLAARNPDPQPRLLDGIGAVLMLVAIWGEHASDAQLSRFRADAANKGRICDVGLWGRSRHPNYFFEWLVWVAYVPIAIDLSGAYGWGWLAVIGPAFMYWILVYASGIPPLEAHMLRSRGDAFRAYQARTNAFFPGLRAARGSH